MKTISVTCENCGKVLEAKESAAGKQAYCPQCGDIVEIPGLEASQNPSGMIPVHVEAQNNVAPAASVTLPNGNTDASPTPERPKCPACSRPVMIKSAKCLFCGANLSPEEEKLGTSYAALLDHENQLSNLEIVLSILFAPVTCLGGLIYLMQGKAKGSKIVGISLISMGVIVVLRLVQLGFVFLFL